MKDKCERANRRKRGSLRHVCNCLNMPIEYDSLYESRVSTFNNDNYKYDVLILSLIRILH